MRSSMKSVFTALLLAIAFPLLCRAYAQGPLRGPNSVAFAAENVGTSSPTQQITLQNVTAYWVSISSITVTGDFQQTNNCGNGVNFTHSCTMWVTFTPTTVGTRTGVITIMGRYQSGPNFYPYTETISLSGTGSLTGFINPKYKIVGIDYTVPGQQSFVQYTNTTMMGTSTSTSSSFSTNVSASFTICGGTNGELVGGNLGTVICGTYSNSFTQESDTSASMAVNQTTSYTNKWSPLTGPALDHGNDVIYVWLNPQLWYTMYPTSTTPGPTPLVWNGYSYDTQDDSNNMEVVPLRLSELLNPSTIPAGIQGRLLRAWAPTNTDGSGPTITNQDLLNIAATDPFSNPNYTVTIGTDGKTTTDNRFTQTTNNPMFYVPGGNYTYFWQYSATDTQGQGGKTTYTQGFAIEEKFNASLFIANLNYDLKQSTLFTWVDQWNNLTTQMTGQSNTVSITGPTGTYTGPSEFNIYQDNVYGTFMVAPVPPQ